mgnify:CR=1 FL=1
MQDTWSTVDRYFNDRLTGADEALDAALARSRDAGLPDIAVAPNQGKLLMLFARMCGARRILEIGTLGGYSTIWLARGLADGGNVVTLEHEPKHAEVARTNIDAAGLGERVEIRVGPALEALKELVGEDQRFDLVFFDADKAGLPGYFGEVLKMSRPGTTLVFDNVVRRGRVIEPGTGDPSVDGVRALTEMLGKEPRVAATALQTVGDKGYDGFMLAVVTA